MHLQYLGYPIANDQQYGGTVINENKPTQYDVTDFENSYQNKDSAGKKMFVKLWLHAARYKYRDITVETPPPEWTQI